LFSGVFNFLSSSLQKCLAESFNLVGSIYIAKAQVDYSRWGFHDRNEMLLVRNCNRSHLCAVCGIVIYYIFLTHIKLHNHNSRPISRQFNDAKRNSSFVSNTMLLAIENFVSVLCLDEMPHIRIHHYIAHTDLCGTADLDCAIHW
jgi:hypothetical protein